MIKAYFDGACEPINPGGTASYGVVIYQDEKMIWRDSQVFIPIKGRESETSNNVAEYSGFEGILNYLIEHNLRYEKIIIYGDSKLVIEQMFGTWKIRNGFYVPIALRCKELIDCCFKDIKGQWIPREENSFADALSKDCLKKAGIVERRRR